MLSESFLLSYLIFEWNFAEVTSFCQTENTSLGWWATIFLRLESVLWKRENNLLWRCLLNEAWWKGEVAGQPRLLTTNRKIPTHLFLTLSSFRSHHLGHWWCRKDDSSVFLGNHCHRLVPENVNCQIILFINLIFLIFSPWSSKFHP